MATLNLDEVLGWCDAVRRKIKSCVPTNQDRADIMEHWERLIEEDNREGVLKGEDRYGIPMHPVTYRPVRPGVRLTVGQRLGQHPRKQRGRYAGLGKYANYGILPNNNLRSSEYRLLDGPPLAPRRQFSRVISNLATGNGYDPVNPSRWFATGAWGEVVSVKGVHFLPYHFKGEGQLQRDLRGVRPEGLKRMRESAYQWAKLLVRRLYGAA